MSIRLWYCKYLVKSIEKKNKTIDKLIMMIKKYRTFIKNDKKRLSENLKLLTDEENIKYGYECGFIDEMEYQIMMNGGDSD